MSELGFQSQMITSTYNRLILSAEAEGSLEDAFQVKCVMNGVRLGVYENAEPFTLRAT